MNRVSAGRAALSLPMLSISAAVSSVLLSACAVGPNYKTPPAPEVKAYVPGNLAPATSSTSTPGGQAQRFLAGDDVAGDWWNAFQSPQLNELITRALAHNPTLAAAQAALRNANETLAAQRGSYYPTVTGNFQAEREKASGAAFGLPQLGSFLYTLNNASVNVSYGIDVFGGTRRQVESQQAQRDYERFALEASYLTLTTNIVTTAVNEASLREQIKATEEIAQSQQRQLEITQRRVTAGGASRADVAQQQATLSSTLATLPALRTQLAQYRNQLATYVGELPADFQAGTFTLDSLTLPTDLPLSLPSKLVEQRPDVREYAAQLHETTAQVGVATANMLPQFTLTASYGGDATKFSDIFNPASNVWSLVGGLTQPIFEGGKLRHQRAAAIAAAQEAAANYKATVLTAFQNVADTLIALQGDADAFAASDASRQAAAESLRLVQAQYKSGGASYTQVLSSEQTYQNAVLALVKARALRYADTAALFQALGGGWWNRTDDKSDSSDCCKGS